ARAAALDTSATPQPVRGVGQEVGGVRCRMSAALKTGQWLASVALTVLGIASLGLGAREAHAVDACAPKPFRWEEDCSVLGLSWLRLGAEYRLKTEYLDAPDYGLKPADVAYTAVGERALFHIDLRPGLGVRGFVQLAAATD